MAFVHSPPQTSTGIDGKVCSDTLPCPWQLCDKLVRNQFRGCPLGWLSSPPVTPIHPQTSCLSFTFTSQSVHPLPLFQTPPPELIQSLLIIFLRLFFLRLNAGACFSVFVPTARGDGCVLVPEVRGQWEPLLLGAVALLEDRFSVIPEIKGHTSKRRHTKDVFHVCVERSRGHQVALQSHSSPAADGSLKDVLMCL